MMLPKGCLVPFSQMAGKGRPIVEQRAKTVLPKQSVAAIQTHFHVYFEMWWDHSSPPPQKKPQVHTREKFSEAWENQQ